MMKLEMHCHTFNTSACADTPNDVIISKYLGAGYSGIVVNNHFSESAYQGYMKGDTHEQKIDSFFNAIDKFGMACQKVNIKCFWSVEVRTISGTEYSVIGLDKSAFYQKPLFNYTQEELFRLAEKHNAFMYQTHPFRQGVNVGDPRYMHGAESFNGHYHHYNNNDKAQEFCEKNKLIGLSGTDYHHLNQPITAGIYAPNDLSTEKDLVNFLFKNDFKIIKEEEVYLSALKKHKGI